MALALERIGWSNAAFWVRRQAQYDLEQERIRQERVMAGPSERVGGVGQTASRATPGGSSLIPG